MATVVSSIDFLGPHDEETTGKPYSLRYEPPDNFPRSNFVSVARNQAIEDVRGHEHAFSVHVQGFGILNIDPQMQYTDYDDEDKIKKIYYKQVGNGVKEMLGASRVQIFEHVLRKRDAQFPVATGQPYKYDQPTTSAHIDMTPSWASAMAEHMNERKGNALPSPNFQFVNIWKPLRGPIRDWPLAVCDSSTLNERDIRAMDVVHRSTVIETYLIHPTETQKWYYLSDQTADEAWVFLQADSELRGQRGVPHSSFRHPDIEQSQFPRESIEVRAIAFYENRDTMGASQVN